MWTNLEPTQELACAKVNLSLHVTGRRPDGYHMLDSHVVFPQIGDVITYEASKTLGLTLDGPFAVDLGAGVDNLVLAAAELIGCAGAALHLEKNLPVASGIGGGSSNAAATLRLLSRALHLPMPGLAQVLSLGADVPVCLSARPQRMQGIGEILSPIPVSQEFWLVLVNPGVPLRTAQIFAGLETVHNPCCDPWPETRNTKELADFLRGQRNDLQAIAEALCPAVTAVLMALEQSGAMLARMSGSGATCFGLFENAEASLAASDMIRKAMPGWWVAAGPVR